MGPRDINISYSRLQASLNQLYTSTTESNCTETEKQVTNLYNWLDTKMSMINQANQSDYIIPLSFLPRKIFEGQFDYIKDKFPFITNYYQDSSYPNDPNKYIKTVTPKIPEEIFKIATYTSLAPRQVVTIDFGYNIGIEFGGPHMAIILKCYERSLLVIPLSSQPPTNSNSRKHVKIERKYGFPNNKDSWTNVGKIRMLSIHRVDFTKKTCSVHKSEIEKIKTAINNCGIYDI
ncbi:type II toxin-antitoxin system PemK/MazF family toxin [Mammaliicoccus sciuri]|uniref:type II toxin-antitoxin system PemK/MazF family toxin n=1 Tax=Mammaliicoccus sciuri TaxID=1296 RepID=UPI002DBC8256|nr:type II toxin-antitoxin system PemK/MazF family toxin [Mammaliicoccus sciuri]MEB7423278.1 type II toxin-antitoxin system PemK/MazF family toxin [Mammaliicoccus sciuri]